MIRTPLSSLTLLEPRSLRDALAMLHDRKDEGPLTPLAGGTDLYVTLNAGTERARRFIDLWRLDGLRRIEARKDVLSIGALATYTAIQRSPLANRRIPMLVAASREVGGVQIQNRGTLGGNIANASPAGDTLPVLAAAEAVIVLASKNGERRVPYADFQLGYRATVRRDDELIVAIEIPRIEGRQWFCKVGTRAAQAISKVVAAGIANGPSVRFALGAVAPTVVRAKSVEAALARHASVAEAQDRLLSDIAPIDDLRSTRSYRARVAQNLLARFLGHSSGVIIGTPGPGGRNRKG